MENLVHLIFRGISLLKYGIQSDPHVIVLRFIKQYGKRLRILRLENCSFLNNEALYSISTSCPYLQGCMKYLFGFIFPAQHDIN